MLNDVKEIAPCWLLLWIWI